MLIGIRAHDLPERDITSLSQKLFKLGITEIQLALPKSIDNIDFSTGKFTPMLARNLKTELSKNNISIAVLGCYINLSTEDESARNKEIDRFVENLKYAKYMNADMVGTETGGYSPEKIHSEEAYAVMLDSVKKMVSAAEKLGVRVGIEGVSAHPLSTPEKMYRLMNDIKSPNLAVIFDPVNLITPENYKEQHKITDKAFSLYGDKIEAIHLKDFDIKNGEKIEAKIFDGIFDHQYLIEKIKTEKPHLPILLECESQETYPIVKEKLMGL